MFFKRKKSVENMYSPVNGTIIPLEEVPDKMFSEKLLGDGFGFILKKETIYAPCDCSVTMLAQTKHAIGLKSNSGLEILIHVGLDTVNLKGQGFDLLVEENQVLKRGTPLLRVDLSFMSNNNIDLITPMIFTNGNDFEFEALGLEEVTTDLIIAKVIA